MMKKLSTKLYATVFLLSSLSSLAPWVIAQPRQAPNTQAYVLSAAPKIDGNVADDAVWKLVVPTQGFWQTQPNEGLAATQYTQVFIGYTNEALYIGVICFDEQPDQIIVTDTRRDSSLSDTDSFRVMIDAFQDKQNGFVFGTNPAGVEYDGQITGEGGGSFNPGGGEFNLNWDTTWEVEAQITEQGWSAEMEIPFKALRYPNADVQTWGINFQRNIRRNNEEAYWAPLPRQYDITRVSLAGKLTDIHVPSQQNFKFTPYVLSKTEKGGTLPSGTHSDEEVGFDIKYSVTPSLILDATYNTDFAQVEVDEFQVNLDRFSLFFPEKRPFFLENAGYFTMGKSREVELFFSRRIGIGALGAQIPVDGGLRLSGKIGNDTNVGLLHMQTDSVDGIAPENAYSVVRVNQQLPNRSAVGFVAVNRDGDGSTGVSDDYNRTYGLDGQWGIGDNAVLSGFFAKTDTPGLSGKEHAGSIDYNFNSEDWVAGVGYSEVGNEFNPEVGFLSRRNYKKYSGNLLRRIRPENLWGLQELRPHINYRGFWDFDGFQQSGFLHIDNHWEWKSGFEVHTGINFTKEGVQTPFNIGGVSSLTVPVGNYSNREFQFVLFTNQSAPLSFRLNSTVGGYFSGDRVNLEPTARYRIGEKFSTELTWSHNQIDLDLPGAEGDIDIGRLRLSYSFTPRIAVQALVQYNEDDEENVLATNLRFSWLQSANSGFFFVYNEVDEDYVGAPPKGKEYILKYSRIFDIL
jgi:hypothetical protein